MGAPKQKWTEEEEAALKAGVIKHGAGKWRTILKDPEFNNILFLRSNVDLKDKWRNLSAIANGWGPREKSRVALRRSHHVGKHDDDPMALSTVVKDLDDILDVEAIATSSYHLQITGPKQSIPRLDDLIFEAITSLKEPNGSDKISIVIYIEDQYDTSLNLEQLSAKLKTLTASRRLVRVNRKYRLAPTLAFEKRSSRSALERQRHRLDKDDFKPFKSQIDAELARMRKMTAEEAAFVAAQAVAEAEAAMEEAEEAMRDAEAAEADAEEARSFAKAAILTLKRRNDAKLME